MTNFVIYFYCYSQGTVKYCIGYICYSEVLSISFYCTPSRSSFNEICNVNVALEFTTFIT